MSELHNMLEHHWFPDPTVMVNFQQLSIRDLQSRVSLWFMNTTGTHRNNRDSNLRLSGILNDSQLHERKQLAINRTVLFFPAKQAQTLRKE
jgi:hypothetical protein